MITKDSYRVGVVGLTDIAADRNLPEPEGILTTLMPASHMEAYAFHPKTEVVGVCELNPDLIKGFKEAWGDEFPHAKTYTDYREMIDKESLDILSVCTSDNVHTDIASFRGETIA